MLFPMIFDLFVGFEQDPLNVNNFEKTMCQDVLVYHLQKTLDEYNRRYCYDQAIIILNQILEVDITTIGLLYDRLCSNVKCLFKDFISKCQQCGAMQSDRFQY